MAARYIHETTLRREGFVFLRCSAITMLIIAWYFFGFIGPGAYSSDANTTSVETQDQTVFNSPLWNLDWIEKQYGMFPKPLA